MSPSRLHRARTSALLIISFCLILVTFAIGVGEAFAQSFSPPTSYVTGSNPNWGLATDFNGDGKPDFATANFNSGDLSVLLNNGDGTFASTVTYTTDLHPQGIVAADFNKDNKTDLAVGNFDGGTFGTGGISILLGNGNGTFQAAVNFDVRSPNSLATVDLNGDTNLDLVTGSFFANSVSVLLGNGNGTFQAPVSYPTNTFPAKVVLADFNSDGKSDVLVGCNGGGINLLLGNGNGTFQASTPISADSGFGLAIADLNGDGKQDFINALSTRTQVFLGNGDGTFQAGVYYNSNENSGQPAIADLNGDGNLDIAVGNVFTAVVSVLRGNGNGTFQAPITSPAKPNPAAVVASDLNVDGKPDLVAISNGTGRVNVLLNSPAMQSVAINSAAGASSTATVASFIDYDATVTACNFLASVNWGDGTASTFATVVANGGGGFNVIGTHTYAVSGIYVVNVQLIDDRGNYANKSSTATVGVSDGKLLAATAGSGQNSSISTAFTNQLQATYTESGLPVSGVLITFSAPNCGASGKFSATGTTTESILTDGNGIATASMFTANSIGGSYLVNATVGSGSPATSFALTNNKLDQTITFGSLADKTFGDADFSVSATASSGLAVTFGASGNCTVSGSTVHLTGAGSCTITASQAGNDSYNPAPNVPQSFTIAKSNQTITFGALPSRTLGDPDFTVSATASSGLAVSFGAAGNCTISTNTVHLTGAGSCTITASQAGDANYNAAPNVPQSFTIAKSNQTITFGALSNKTFGDPDFTVNATASSSLTVSFAASGNCTISLTTVHLTGGGSCTITASQAGDTNYNAAPNVPQSFTIAKAQTTTAISSSVNPSDFGQSIVLNVTVSFALGGVSGGTVQFKDNGTNLGAPISLNTAGVGSLTTSSLTAATHTITADYAGTADFATSTGTLSGGQVVRPLPSLSVNDVSVIEGDSGTKLLNFTVTLSAASNLNVNLTIATANGTATAASDYVARNNSLAFTAGETSKTVGVTINGDVSFEPDENFALILSLPVNATISRNTGFGTIIDDDVQGGFISLSQSNSTVSESAGFITITVNRTNDVSRPVTVDYATDDTGSPATCSSANGLASGHCDFTRAVGTLNFAAGEAQKTFTVLISRDSYVEAPEMFQVTLSAPTNGAVLATPFSAVVTISDDSAGLPPNVIDDAGIFVRMHYHDFLNREPDQSGLDFWTSQITSCGTDAQCAEVRRIDVSASFFLSIEFQQSGYLVERFYKSAYGDAQGTSNFPSNHQLSVPIVRFDEFIRDTQRIGRGVIVLQPGWEQLLENNKQAYAQEFVQTSRFTAANAFPTTMTPAQFVDKLNLNAGNVLSASERTTAINLFGGAGNSSNVTARARAVRQVAEDTDLFNAEFNRAFVLTQYFGYLRRNPNDAPESTLDYTGYDFWLTKLNQFNGSYVNAEMVKAFLSSIEYRQRFGP